MWITWRVADGSKRLAPPTKYEDGLGCLRSLTTGRYGYPLLVVVGGISLHIISRIFFFMRGMC